MAMMTSQIFRSVDFRKSEKPIYLNIYNPAQSIWHKLKKSSKIGQDFKNLLSDFACFLTAIVQA